MAMRRYSVSSSPLAPGADPNVVTVTVGQVKFTTGTGRHIVAHGFVDGIGIGYVL